MRRTAASKGHGRKGLSDSHFRQLAERSDDVFWLGEPESRRLLYVSPGVKEIWGLDPDALYKEPHLWTAAVLPDDASGVPEPFLSDDGEAFREYRVRRPDGCVRWVRERRFSWVDESSGTHRMGGIAEDITERKSQAANSAALLQRERDARASAEAAAQSKDEFLAVVTHELRSPLNAIRGWSHVLRQSAALDPAQLKALDAIDRNTLAQARLVDDLLDSQRILCGRLRLERACVPMSSLVEEAAEAVHPAAQLKRIRIETMNELARDMVRVDPNRMRQALEKLLSNAVKFTPEDGTVQVRTMQHANNLIVEVVDTGLGLEPERLPSMFDAFHQADSSRTRSASGLGLGLSLARQLVELHGGTLRAASEGLGRGSTFTIELPPAVWAAQGDAQPLPAASTLAGRRVVVVEDDDDGREALTLILREAQHPIAKLCSRGCRLCVPGEGRRRRTPGRPDLGHCDA